MNCHEAYLWMLEAEEPTATPPVAVSEHLRDCSKCRRRQRRVLRLLTAVQQLPPPPDNPQARANVIARVRQSLVPKTRRRSKAARQTFFSWWRVAALVAAVFVVAALVVGLLYSLHDRSKPVTPLTDLIASAWKDGDLRTQLLQRDLRLAEAKAPTEQLAALSGMASDLQHETIKQAGRVDVADLSLLAALYERVIHEGVLPSVRMVPPPDRKDVLPPLVAELRKTQMTAEQAAAEHPAAAEPLRRLARTAGEAAGVLDKPVLELPAPKPKGPEATGPFVETLVVQGLRLAGETDLLKRADIGVDLVDNLVQALLAASKNGSDREEMVKLGAYLGAAEHALVVNLNHVTIPKPDTNRQKEYDRVNRRAEKIMEDFRTNVQNAPPDAKPGLEEALVASQYPR
jgi:hypothetical protein